MLTVPAEIIEQSPLIIWDIAIPPTYLVKAALTRLPTLDWRCNLDCKIDTGFKRVGKRVKNAEMERELLELRRQLAGKWMR